MRLKGKELVRHLAELDRRQAVSSPNTLKNEPGVRQPKKYVGFGAKPQDLSSLGEVCDFVVPE